MAQVFEQTTAPTAEPLHLDEVKDHLKVEHADDDDLISLLIASARDYVEVFLSRQIVAATYQLKMDSFPSEIVLPRPPLLSVDSITYVDAAGSTQTVTGSVYTVLTNREPGKIILAYGQSWPTTRGHTDDIVVTFRAGYIIPISANSTTDVVTWSGLSPTDDDIWRLSNSSAEDGALPAGISALTDYHVISASGATSELSATSGGAKIDITDTGDGQSFAGVLPGGIVAAMKLLVGGWYEFREAQVEGKLADNPAAERLLWPHRIMGGL